MGDNFNVLMTEQKQLKYGTKYTLRGGKNKAIITYRHPEAVSMGS
jgi:hypothetical protein